MKKLLFSLFTFSFSLFTTLCNAQTVVNYSYTGALQSWVVPAGVTEATIAIAGGGGGANDGYGNSNGASLSGACIITSGHTVSIAVAGAGVPSTAINYVGNGGGGGTFVYDSNTNNLLIVGGGAGGNGDTYNSDPEPGGSGGTDIAGNSTTGGGGDGSQPGGSGGNGGSSGNITDESGGGAGWLSNGSSGSAGGGNDRANGFNGGGSGFGGNGGFGGGGGGYGGGGGGGGYNGGGGGNYNGDVNFGGGGGGASYLNGSLVSGPSANNGGNGYASISYFNIGVIISSHTDVCTSGTNGTATALATAGTAPFHYLWSPGGQTTATISGLSAGSYTVTLTDAISHTAIAIATITQGIIVAVPTQASNISCTGSGPINASANANITDGVAPYTYSWSNGSSTVSTTNPTGNVLTAGTYTVTIQDKCADMTTASVTITQPTLSATASQTTAPTCFGGANGSANVITTNGTLPYTYSWSNGSSTVSTTNPSGPVLSAQTYTVTIQDLCGLETTASVTITQPVIITTTAAQTQGNSCFGGSIGIALASPVDGRPPYTYSWSNGSSTVSTANPTAAILTAGTYTVTVMDSCGNSATATATITEPNALATTAAETVLTCGGGSNGDAMAYASNGTPPYTYTWSNGSSTVSTANPTGQILPAGTYTVTVQDNCGSTVTASATISSAVAGIWMGGTSTDWNDPTNWCGGVPNNTTNVIIPSGTIYSPTTNTGPSAVCNNITINSGATLTIVTSLTVSGNWSDTGNFNPGTNTVIFNAASGTQTINEGGSFYDVTFTGTGTLQAVSNHIIITETLTNSNGGTLDLNGLGIQAGDLQSPNAGIITNSNAAATNTRIGSDGNTDNFTGTIQDGAGTVSVILNGGILTLSNANPFSGGMNLQGGTLNISNAAAIGSGTFTISGGNFDNTSGAPMTLNNNAQTWSGTFHFIGTNNLNMGAGTVFISNTTMLYVNTLTSNLTVGGVISESTSYLFYKYGSGILTLTGANTITGGVSLAQGQLNINNAQAIGTGRLTISGATTIDNTSGAPITLSTNNLQTWGGSYTFVGSNNLNMGTGAVTLSASITITTTTAGSNLTEGGVISGARSITKAGLGTLILSGVNAYTAGTILSAGQLNINNAKALGGSVASRLTIDAGTTIDNTSGAAITLGLAYPQTWAGSFTFVGSNNLNMSTGAVTLSASPTVTTTTSGSVLTEGGVIGGAFATTKAGAGTLTLTANNTYTGATTINAGILSIGADANLGAAPGSATAGQLSFGGGTLAATNTFALNANRGIAINASGGTIDVASTKTLIYTGSVVGGALTSTDAGTLTFLNASVSLSNLTINSGNNFIAPLNTMNLTGNFSNSGNYTNSSGIVNFNGGTAQTIGGSANTAFYNLTIDNTSGGVTLNQSETVNTNLTLTSGQLILGTNNLLMSPGAITLGESTSSYIVTNSTGTFTETYNGDATYLFPVGDAGAGDYTPMRLGATSGTSGGLINVLVNNTKESHITASTNYLNRFWTISQSGLGTFSDTVQGSYLASDVIGTPADINTAQWTGSSFTQFSAINNSSDSISAIVSSFGDFTGIPPAGLLTTTASATTNVSCYGGNNGSATASPSGGTSPYTYLWSDGNLQSTATATGLSAGSYTVTATDAASNMATASVTITQPGELRDSISTFTNPTCYGSHTGSISVIAIEGTAPYNYSWTGGNTNATATGLSNGSYTVTVSDACGATATASATLEIITSITFSQENAVQNWQVPAGVTQVTISVAGAAGGSANGSSDYGGYGASFTGICTVIPWHIISMAVGAQGVNSANNDGGGGGGTFVYDSNTVSLFVIGGGGGGAGTGNVSHLDGGGGGIDISPPYATTTGVTYAGDASGGSNGKGGSAGDAGAGTGGGAGWFSNGADSGSSGGNDRSNLFLGGVMPYGQNGGYGGGGGGGGSGGGGGGGYNGGGGANTGEYGGGGGGGGGSYINGTVIGTPIDSTTANGFVFISYVVTTPLAITGVSQTNITCNGTNIGTATANVSGGSATYTYAWAPSGKTTAIVTGLSAGTYTVSVTDACGGELQTASVTITQPSELRDSVSFTNITCNGGTTSATANVGGGNLPYTYLWSNGASTQSITGLTAGTYSVNIKDACGTDSIWNFTITQPNALATSLTEQDVPITLTNSQSSATASGFQQMVTVNSSLYTSSENAGLNNIEFTTGPNATGTVLQGWIESGATNTSTATVYWINLGTSIIPASGTLTIYMNFMGSSVLSAAGPTGESPQIANASTYDNGSLVFKNYWSFYGTSLPAGLTYSNGGGGSMSYSATQAAKLYVPGAWSSFLISNATYSAPLVVESDMAQTGTPAGSALVSLVTSTDASLAGSSSYAGFDETSSGTDFTFVAGYRNGGVGFPAFAGLLGSAANNNNYNIWSLGINSAGNLGFGDINYTSVATPSTTETVSAFYIGLQTTYDTAEFQWLRTRTYPPSAVMPSVASGSPLFAATVISNGSCNGSISVSPTGGTMPYTYSWAPAGGSNATATGLTVGTYSVTVTDACGVIQTATATITQPPALSSTATVLTNPLCYGSNTGSALASPSGGSTPYTYLWSNGETAITATGLVAGTYSVSVSDACGAIVSASVTIQALNSITFSQENAVQNWTVPLGITQVTVTLAGGAGYEGGNGASFSGLCTVTPGHHISIAVGGAGNNTNDAASGGGGGSFVYDSNTIALLAVAGGGGGGTGNGGAGVGGTDLVNNTTTASSDATSGAGGTGGAGGGIGDVTPAGAGAGGAGWIGNGNSFSGGNLSSNGGMYRANGFLGGIDPFNSNYSGGYGGGGGGCGRNDINAAGSGTGGGGGYNGGGGGSYVGDKGAGGGGSYLNGTVIGSPTANNAGNGFVTISYVFATPLTITGVSQTNITCNGTNIGTATVAVNGGSVTYNYVWAPSGKTTATATGLSAGTYTVSVTDACGGELQTASVTITQPSELRDSVNFTNITCNGGTTSATANVGGGVTPYTYQWSDASSQTTATASGLGAGTYSVSIMDACGADSTLSFTVTQPNALGNVIASVTSNVSCNGDANGSASVNPSGGTTPYTYLWSNNQTTATITGLSAGTYSVGVKDNCGADSLSSIITITQPANALNVIASTTSNVSCSTSGSVASTVSGGTSPYTYTWAPTGGNNATATGLTAGTYTLGVTDANGCTLSSTTVITQPANTIAAIANVTANVTCNGGDNGSLSSTVSGGATPYTYLWTGGGTNATVSTLVAGTYTLTVQDNSGCSSLSTAIITEPSVLSASANTITNVSCNGDANGSASVNPSGGTTPYTYLWSNNQTTATITGLSAGTYSVGVKDNCGADSLSSIITITQPANALNVIASTTSNVSCSTSGSVASTVSGGTSPYTYTWAPTGGNNATATGLTAGTYTLGVTDANGCTLSSTTVITQPANTIAAIANVTANVTCNGGDNGSLSSTVSGGATPYTYLWTGGGTNATVSTLVAGTYTLTVQDNSGCSSLSTAIITEPSVLSASANTITNVSCNAGNNGIATANVSGGTTPYTYLWSDSQTAVTASGLTAGTYTVKITDACGGDLVTASVIITQPTTLLGNTTVSFTNVTCNGGNNGTASVNPSGGNSPYTYTWSNGESTATATGLSAGTYNVSVMDACGADSVSSTITITQPSQLGNVIASVTSNVTCNGTNSGSAMVSSPSGGSTPYTYLWSDASSQNTATATGLSAGTYNVSVMDACGADSVSSTITITQPSQLGNVIASVTSNVTCNGTNSGSAMVSSQSGGSTPYTYLWSDASSQNTATATGLSAGTYNVSVMDACGADSISATITITQPAMLSNTGVIVISNVTCAGSTNGSASVTPLGGSTPYTYLWSDGSSQTTATATGLSAGNYSVSIMDACGADSVATVTISSPTALTVTIFGGNIRCYGEDDGTAHAHAHNGSFPYTYSWSNGGTVNDVSGLSAGTYSVAVTDACGTLVTETITLTQPPALVVTSDSTLNTGSNNGTASVTATGGTAPYTYDWNPGGETTSSISGLSGGSYCCTVTDRNGCSQTVCIAVGTLGIDNISNSSNVNIYPDPTIGNFTITGVEQGQVIELYNYIGEKLSSTTVENNTTMHFDISNKANGIYLIRILNTDGTLVTEKKLVKTQ